MVARGVALVAWFRWQRCETLGVVNPLSLTANAERLGGLCNPRAVPPVGVGTACEGRGPGKALPSPWGVVLDRQCQVLVKALQNP